jgi:hypothetical protein
VGTYMIGYDLNGPAKDYEDLWEAIKQLDAWWHHLDSTWLVKTSESAVAIRDKLKGYLDTDDELLVVNVSGAERAWCGFDESGSKWLKETY